MIRQRVHTRQLAVEVALELDIPEDYAIVTRVVDPSTEMNPECQMELHLAFVHLARAHVNES